MTWAAVHRRGDVLRTVVAEADRRRDGVLPVELPGVAETFGDEQALVSALQLRWHTRLAGHVERALMESPAELETAVLTAWRRTASELAGVRAILDAYVAEPDSDRMAESLRRANRKDWVLLASMAGQASPGDAGAARVGRRLEARARAAYDPTAPTAPTDRRDQAGDDRPTWLDRLKAHLAA